MAFAALAIAVCAAWFDWRARRIPNWLTLTALAIAIAIGGLDAIAGAILCASIPLVLWSRGVLGGGDVKLLAALGATQAFAGVMGAAAAFVFVIGAPPKIMRPLAPAIAVGVALSCLSEVLT